MRTQGLERIEQEIFVVLGAANVADAAAIRDAGKNLCKLSVLGKLVDLRLAHIIRGLTGTLPLLTRADICASFPWQTC